MTPPRPPACPHSAWEVTAAGAHRCAEPWCRAWLDEKTPRPSASGDPEHASATHRTVLLHAIAIGARPERVEAIVEALIVAVRAETLEEAAKEMRYQFDASKHDLDLNGIIKCRTYKDAELRIRALAVPK